MSRYVLKNFSNELFVQARAEWEAFAGGEVFDVELAPAFVWAEAHMVPTPNDSVALCLLNKDIDRIEAIVEVVDSRQGQMSKLLKVIPSPIFWVDDGSSREKLIQLYVEVFFNVITGGGFTASRKVKLYGRDDEMMSILRSIHAHWGIQNSSAEFEGRFLAISIN